MYETVPEFLRFASDKYGQRTALYIRRFLRTTKFSFREVDLLAHQLAAHLRNNGVTSGDVVLIWAPNMPEWVLALFGSLTLGAVVVPVGLHSSKELVEKYISQTHPKILFVSKYYPLEASLAKKDSLKQMFLEDIPDLVEKIPIGGVPKVEKEALAEIVFTSGTTGEPKGVMISHQNILFEIEQLLKTLPAYKHYRLLSILPLSHVMEQIVGLITPLARGATIYYVPRVNTLTIKKALAKYHITDLGVVPQMLRMFLDSVEYQVDQEGESWLFNLMLKITPFLPIFIRRGIFGQIHHDLGNKLYVFGVGSAPLDVKLAQAWEAMGIKVVEGYGASETTGGVTANRINRRRLGSVGKRLPGMEVVLSPEKEILVKGDNVSQGYYKNPEKNREAYTSNGYFRTGDIGYFDKDGWLFINGREKFKIVTAAGDKIYPEDVERKINSFADVWDSCVTGIKKGDGEIVFAAVILKPQAKTKLEDLINKINLTLEPNQRILDFIAWPEIDFPRLHTLKVDRNQVKEIVEAKLTGKEMVQKATVESGDKLLDILAKVCKVSVKEIKENSVLVADLGLDSLKRVELVSFIEEELEKEVGEEQIGPKTTVKELRESLKKPENDRLPYNLETIKSILRSNSISYIRALFSVLVIFPFMRIFLKISKKYLLDWRDLPRGIVYVGNHPGFSDMLMVTSGLPPGRMRRMIKLADDITWDWRASFLYRSRIFDALMGVLPINKTGKAMRPSLESVLDILDDGWDVLIAPEGRQTPKGKRLGKIRDGAATLFADTNVTIVPYWVEGKFKQSYVDHISSPLEVFPKLFSKFLVTYGKPFTLKGLSIEEGSKLIREKILETGNISEP